jgi:cell division transport system permease protein
MAAPDLDLPLAKTPASRFLAWTVAGLVYLGVMALAVAAIANGTLLQIARQPRILTVALPATADRAAGEALTRRVVALLRGMENVAYTDLVPQDEIGKLVLPWLDKGADAAPLPLPQLIDVAFDPGIVPDAAALESRLQDQAPGATVGDTAPERGSTQHWASALRMAGALTGGMALLVVAAAVLVITRMSLDLHQQTVDLLRQMGAPDPYLVRQLEQHALANGMRGGLQGLALAVCSILAILYLPLARGGGRLVGYELQPLDWIGLAAVPVVAALIITVVTRLAAMGGLRRLG